MNALAVKDGPGWCRLCAQVRTEIGQLHRYTHSINVARSAELLAMRHGLDPKPARVAGLLHDLARLWSTERLLEACAKRGYPISDFEREYPIVLHAPMSAALARERYGVEDRTVLRAIERHTLGAVEMSPLDTVVYLADALEPGRKFPERREYWALALRDLDAGLVAVYLSTKHYLEQRGLRASPQLEADLLRLTTKGYASEHTP